MLSPFLSVFQALPPPSIALYPLGSANLILLVCFAFVAMIYFSKCFVRISDANFCTDWCASNAFVLSLMTRSACSMSTTRRRTSSLVLRGVECSSVTFPRFLAKGEPFRFCRFGISECGLNFVHRLLQDGNDCGDLLVSECILTWIRQMLDLFQTLDCVVDARLCQLFKSRQSLASTTQSSV